MSIDRRSVFAIFALCGLAACQNAPAPPPAAPIDYSAFGPIVLDVASIDVVDRHRTPPVAIDAQARTSAVEAVRTLVSQRLKAGGSAGKATVTITEAGVEEERLATTEGMSSLFKNELSARYNGKVALEITAQKPLPNGSVHGSTKASATATATVLEKSSIAEREATLADLIRSMTDTLNARLDAGVRKDLAKMVLR